MMFCDSHIHLLDPAWQATPESLVASAAQSGIGLLLQPGVASGEWQPMLQLAQRHAGVRIAPGVHPRHAAEWNAGTAAELAHLCRQPEVVAVGEIGLDAEVDVAPELQQQAFCCQAEIAVDNGLPLLLHCRKRTGALLGLLEKFSGGCGGIWHGFSGSLETARQLDELGFVIGVGPVLLRDNARKLPEVVRELPAHALVLETDAPDMAAGPEVLVAVAQKLAELRGWSLDECARITTATLQRVLRLDGLG